ncbi:hypothetical protein, partial [Serratia marcescens]|uniref:hypothetical protein n=1 Tax=Serratia marcescens TaxID=615 RepID=UPI0028132A19
HPERIAVTDAKGSLSYRQLAQRSDRLALRLIAELEDAEQKLCAANVTLDARASEAEAKLATPVRLPSPACTYADHSYPAYSRKQVGEIITSAGMRFTVEGDE